MGLVPLPERSGIDLDDGRLDEGVGSDKLVVGSVVRLGGGRYERKGRERSAPLLGRSSKALAMLAEREREMKEEGKEETSTHNSHNSGLLGAVLGSPSEVTGLQPQSSVLDCSMGRQEKRGGETPKSRGGESSRREGREGGGKLDERFPPRTRTVWIRLAPILVEAAVERKRGEE